MTRSHKVLGFLFVVMFGLYGCARGPSAGTGDRAALEQKVQRLEEDFRAAAGARDSFRQRLLAAEDKLAQTQKALDQANATVSHERTELKARTQERDALQTQYDGFRKNIKELLGSAEAALNQSKPDPSVVVAPTSPASAANQPTAAANIRN